MKSSKGKGKDATDKLLISVEDMTLNELVHIPADLVVLSTAMVPSKDSIELGKLLGIKIGTDGFFQEAHMKLQPVETNVRGIYIAGACRGPTDIPTSIVQAKAASSEADTELRRKKIKLPENVVSAKN